jgi:hypothetical protein
MGLCHKLCDLPRWAIKHTLTRQNSGPIPLNLLDESALLGTARLAGWLLLGIPAGSSRYR